jgi:predicted  nucleic acid-binding Zn-ribbon protein
MFKFVAIALLVAVASANYQFKDTKTVLAEIDNDKFGNTLLSAVQLNLASKAPLDDVIVLIDQIIDNLNNQQDDADKANVTNQADCEETIQSLESQIAETTQTIAQLE